MNLWRIFTRETKHEPQAKKPGRRSSADSRNARLASTTDWLAALDSLDFASAQMAAANSQTQGARIFLIHVRRSRMVELLRMWRLCGYRLKFRGRLIEACRYEY